MDDSNRKKTVFALSRGSYRGISLYELMGNGVGLFLGILFHKFGKLEEATAYIDQWYEAKRN